MAQLSWGSLSFAEASRIIEWEVNWSSFVTFNMCGLVPFFVLANYDSKLFPGDRYYPYSWQPP